jgi:hypothetical protein
MSTKNEIKVLGDVKSFTIDRKRWYRGMNFGSALLKQNGKMCCLGFYAKACGLPNKMLCDVETPADVMECAVYLDHCNTEWATKLVKRESDTDTTQRIVYVNDDTTLTDTIREKRLIALFKRINIAVKFVN